MTRDEGVDILWSLMMASLPLGSDRPNTPEDRAAAAQIMTAFAGALRTLGVADNELVEAHRRYIAGLESFETVGGAS